MKYYLFILIFSFLIFIFGIISLFTAPIINRIIDKDNSWGSQICQKYSDLYNYYKYDDNTIDNETKQSYINYYKEGYGHCYNNKAMYGLEYSSVVMNIFLGFMLSLLSLIFFINKNIINYKRLPAVIVFILGKILLIITLIYNIFSLYIFTHNIYGKEYPLELDKITPDYSKSIYKLNRNRAFAKWDSSKSLYDCFFYDKSNNDSFYIKYNELNEKQYNYDKRIYLDKNISSEINACNLNPVNFECQSHKNISELNRTHYGLYNNISCEFLYYKDDISNNNYKYTYDRWLTTIIFGFFIDLLNLGLIIFAILLLIRNKNKDKNDNNEEEISENNDNNNKVILIN